ncbi:MAG: FmdE family protein [Promethearchaeota archaeon]
MIDPKDYLEFGLKFHGHKCPAMPLGLKMASVAMNILEVSKSQASELFAIVDLGEHHCANCLADGIQVITGCTFGKGNIKRSMKGKFSMTLIDRQNKRGVKVTPFGSWLKKAFDSPFMAERQNGKAPQEIDESIVAPLIKKVLEMPANEQFKVEIIKDISVKIPLHIWDKRLCDKCGELTVAEYGYYINGQFSCADCAGMTSDLLGTRRDH